MEGYLTAVNEFMDQTYDVSPWQTTELLAALVANHCQRNPEQNFGGVIRAMAQTLGAERLQRRSDFVEVASSGETVRLYRSVVEQVQRELANKGFYNGAVDGDFGPGTQAAMRAFQESTGLPEPTGLPDQMSLFRLLVDPQAMGSPSDQ